MGVHLHDVLNFLSFDVKIAFYLVNNDSTWQSCFICTWKINQQPTLVTSSPSFKKMLLTWRFKGQRTNYWRFGCEQKRSSKGELEAGTREEMANKVRSPERDGLSAQVDNQAWWEEEHLQ